MFIPFQIANPWTKFVAFMEYGMSLEILVQDRWDLWGIRLGIRFLGISVSKCDTNSISQMGVVQKKISKILSLEWLICMG